MDFPLVGKFFRRVVESEQGNDSFFVFVPHVDFVSAGKFKFPQNDLNISPLSKKVPKGFQFVTVSLGAIGAQCQYDRDLVASILKDVMVTFI